MADTVLHRVFDTKEAAEKWWAEHQKLAWGYCPSGRISQREDGKWVFNGSQWSSCD